MLRQHPEYTMALVMIAIIACSSGDPAIDVLQKPSLASNSKSTPVLQSTSTATAIHTQNTSTTTKINGGVPSAISKAGSLPKLAVEQAFPHLALARMVHLTYSSPSDNRLFVVLQEGRVVVFDNHTSVSQVGTFLDIKDKVSNRGNEEGLLGLAFDPAYEANGYLYIYYSMENPRRSVISRLSVDPGNPNLANISTETPVLVIKQPYSNHNGGHIVFGPDGYLYIGLGDGGSGGDPHGNGQDRTTLLGSILRIDVSTLDSKGQYIVPADNPFVGVENGFKKEIWAYGFRNPWRFNFDLESGYLWVGDVGQNSWEEVDIVLPGHNYGWNLMEGSHCFHGRKLTSFLRNRTEDCDQAGLELPVVEYDRSGGCSITGGYVYRGTRIPSLVGAYVYGDFCTGKIWAIRQNEGVTTEHRLLADSSLKLSAFGEDSSGELYMLSFDKKIYRFALPE